MKRLFTLLCLILFSVIPSQAPAQLITSGPVANSLKSGLVGWWKLGEGVGTKAYDASGQGNNGTWVGTETGTSGYYSANTNRAWAGTFDGSTNYVDVGTPAVLSITGNITLAARFKVAGLVKANAPNLLSKGYNGSATAYFMGFNSFGASDGNIGVMTCGSYPGAVKGSYSSRNFELAANQNVWFTAVCTWDGYKWKIYINGKADYLPFAIGAPASAATAKVYIGAQDANGTPASKFNGLISDAMIWNRALTPIEALQLSSPTSRMGIELSTTAPVSFYDSNWSALNGTTWQYPNFANAGCTLASNASVTSNILSIGTTYSPNSPVYCAYSGNQTGGQLGILATNITDGNIYTSNQTFQYGTFEAGIRFGAAMHSAVWLLSASSLSNLKWWSGYPDLPGYFEIDIGEILGSTTNTTVAQAIHGATPNQSFYSGSTTVSGATTAVHDYKVVWTSTAVTWYVDGVQTNTKDVTGQTWMQAPVILLISALTDSFGTTNTPIDVTYVRVCDGGGTLVFEEVWGGTPAGACS